MHQPPPIIGTPENGLKYVQYVSLTDLLSSRWAKNPKDHDIGGLHVSVNRFGFRGALLYCERAERIVAGHGRLETMGQKRDAGDAPPEGVVEVDGEWFLPLIRGERFHSDAELEAYIVADNQHTINGGWHDDLLTEALVRVQESTGSLEGMGYDLEDLNNRIADAAREPLGEALAYGGGDGVDPAAEWTGMPEFTHEDKRAFRSLTLHFKDNAAVLAFANLVGQQITPKTRYLWYPEIEIETFADKQYAPES